MKKVIGVIVSGIGLGMLAIMATCWNVFVWSEIYAVFFNMYQRYIHSNIRMSCEVTEYIWMILLTILSIELYVIGSMLGDINPIKWMLNKYSRKTS